MRCQIQQPFNIDSVDRATTHMDSKFHKSDKKCGHASEPTYIARYTEGDGGDMIRVCVCLGERVGRLVILMTTTAIL